MMQIYYSKTVEDEKINEMIEKLPFKEIKL
ncbi:MAG: hypothetical protein UR28_C0012G0023 [Candidatus Peregrinibacteria bacterium GW2011_GWF2_33_10]|nr:MAG: hypothetical protein UR28_C0012G0023 [Candidatus Peregrinibacteria bacterium GW2011_GWF2_33_10]